MIPFSKWIENSLSPPQHKADEIGKDLDGVVSKRLMKLAMDMETEGKGSRQDVLKSIQRIIGFVSQQNQQQSQQQTNQVDPNASQSNQMDPNMMQQNPVA